jgi:RNA polymerase sigma-70 factor (ECF subfamily)
MSEDRSMPNIAELVEKYHQAVYRYAFRLSGSAADAEDLTQQAFLAAQQKLGQLRKPESARSWLFTILRNCFLKSVRRPGHLLASSLELDMDSVPEEVPKEGDLDAELLQKSLDELPENFRLVLVMFYFEDCSYREIAEKLDLPIGTVMSRLARAKGHLRSKLLPTGEVVVGEKK